MLPWRSWGPRPSVLTRKCRPLDGRASAAERRFSLAERGLAGEPALQECCLECAAVVLRRALRRRP